MVSATDAEPVAPGRVRVSFNEVTNTAWKVFRSLGFRGGDCDDAAEMVAWLEVHGLNGLKELDKALDYLQSEARSRPQVVATASTTQIFDAAGASILAVGALAVDMGLSRVERHSLAIIELQNCHNRALITGYLSRCIHHGVSVQAYWTNGRAEPRSYLVSLRHHEDMPTVYTFPTPATPADHSLVITLGVDLNLAVDPVASGIATVATPDSLRAARRGAIQRGIAVEQQLWCKLNAVAARTLVAATVQSRQGAGE